MTSPNPPVESRLVDLLRAGLLPEDLPLSDPLRNDLLQASPWTSPPLPDDPHLRGRLLEESHRAASPPLGRSDIDFDWGAALPAPDCARGTHRWAVGDNLNCKFCGITLAEANKETVRASAAARQKRSHVPTTGNAPRVQYLTKDDTRKMDCPWPPEKGYAPSSPPYRELIEIPEHYHLWNEPAYNAIFILVAIPEKDCRRDNTWLRKLAISHREWEDILFWDRKDQDAANRGKVQQRVNDIVKDWRERFGTP